MACLGQKSSAQKKHLLGMQACTDINLNQVPFSLTADTCAVQLPVRLSPVSQKSLHSVPYLRQPSCLTLPTALSICCKCMLMRMPTLVHTSHTCDSAADINPAHNKGTGCTCSDCLFAQQMEATPCMYTVCMYTVCNNLEKH